MNDFKKQHFYNKNDVNQTLSFPQFVKPSKYIPHAWYLCKECQIHVFLHDLNPKPPCINGLRWENAPTWKIGEENANSMP